MTKIDGLNDDGQPIKSHTRTAAARAVATAASTNTHTHTQEEESISPAASTSTSSRSHDAECGFCRLTMKGNGCSSPVRCHRRERGFRQGSKGAQSEEFVRKQRTAAAAPAFVSTGATRENNTREPETEKVELELSQVFEEYMRISGRFATRTCSTSIQ